MFGNFWLDVLTGFISSLSMGLMIKAIVKAGVKEGRSAASESQMKETELAKREADIARREAALDQVDLNVRRDPNTFVTKSGRTFTRRLS